MFSAHIHAHLPLYATTKLAWSNSATLQSFWTNILNWLQPVNNLYLKMNKSNEYESCKLDYIIYTHWSHDMHASVVWECTLSPLVLKSKVQFRQSDITVSGTGLEGCCAYHNISNGIHSFSCTSQHLCCDHIYTICVCTVSYTHLTLPTNREV